MRRFCSAKFASVAGSIDTLALARVLAAMSLLMVVACGDDDDDNGDTGAETANETSATGDDTDGATGGADDDDANGTATGDDDDATATTGDDDDDATDGGDTAGTTDDETTGDDTAETSGAGDTSDTGDTGETGGDEDLVPDPNPGAAAECGTENVAPGSNPKLRRWPYLNSVSTNSAVILWATDIPLQDEDGNTIDAKTVPVPKGEVRIGRTAEYPAKYTSEVSVLPGSFVGYFHHFETNITGLKPDTEYCYKIFADDEELAGGIKFRTAPASEDAKVTFVMLGDFGGNTTPQIQVRDQMAKLMKERRVDLFLTTGDNAYSDGNYGEWQTRVFEIYREMWLSLPFFVVHGNHDYGTDNAEPSLKLLALGRNAWLEKDKERYYSFDWGPIHFAMIDSESPMTEMVIDRAAAAISDTDRIEQKTEDQDDWLKDDLSKSTKPWKLALWHRPAFSNTKGRLPDLSLQTYIQPILQKFGVQAVFVGHNHLYERYKPVRVATKPTDDTTGQGKYEAASVSTIGEGGVIHVTTGAGGKSLYEADDTKVDPLQAAQLVEYHFVWGEIDGCTMTLHAVDLNGTEFDSVTVDRCKGTP